MFVESNIVAQEPFEILDYSHSLALNCLQCVNFFASYDYSLGLGFVILFLTIALMKHTNNLEAIPEGEKGKRKITLMLHVTSASDEKVDNYRNDIDGLRALAVVAVIVYHMNESWLPGGFMGVDIFFAVSGYVVTLSLLNKVKKAIAAGEEYNLDILAFYKRRLKRLGPSFFLF